MTNTNVLAGYKEYLNYYLKHNLFQVFNVIYW